MEVIIEIINNTNSGRSRIHIGEKRITVQLNNRMRFAENCYRICLIVDYWDGERDIEIEKGTYEGRTGHAFV